MTVQFPSSELDAPEPATADRSFLMAQPITDANEAAESALKIGLETEQVPAEAILTETSEVACPNSWQVFGTTFLTIFLAELGDKTQVTTLLMSAESHAPWVVFAGAGSALVLTSLLGVWLGQWISTRLSPKILEKAAGLTLLLIAGVLLLDVLWG